MKKLRLADCLNRHEYPPVLHRFPRLIRLVHAWNQLLLQRNWATRQALRKLLPSLPKGACILDAGCGEGMHLLPFSKKYPHLVFFGLDKYGGHIRFCERYCREIGISNVSFICHDLEQPLPVPACLLLLCIGTLQYLEQDEVVLEHFHKALKINGVMLLYVPINGRVVLPVYRYFFLKKQHYEKSQNRRRVYSEAMIFEKLNKAGFQIKDKQYTYQKPGIAAHEMYSICLMGLANGGWFAVFFIFALFLLLPVILGLLVFDWFLEKQDGNGLLVIAQKTG